MRASARTVGSGTGRLRPDLAPQPLTAADLLRLPAMWGFVVTTACIEFCRGALFLSLLPAYLTDPQTLGLSVAKLGLVISGQYLADTVCKTPAGWLVDRFGPWRVLAPSLLLAAVAVYLFPHAHSVGMLALLGILFGAGASANWPAVLAGSVALGGMGSRASATSITFLAWLAGGGPGPVLIPFLIGHGYRSAFDLLAIVATGAPCAALLGLSGALHRPGDPSPVPQPAAAPRSGALGALLSNLREAAWLIPGMFVQMLALGLVVPVLLPFARAHLHLSPTTYGLMLLAGGAAAVLCLLPMGRVVDRVGSKRPLVTGLVVAACAVLLLGLARGAAGLLWRVILLGVSYALILPAWNGLTVGKIDAERRGLLLGLFMAIEGLGISAGSAAGGTLYTLGARVPFFTTAVILALAAAFYQAMPRGRFEARQVGPG